MGFLKKFFSKSNKVLSYKTESLGVIAFGIGLILLLTKIAGLLKLQVLAAIYGVQSVELDLFNAANVIPEFIFTIVVIGGINAALIPVFSQSSIHESAERSKRIFSSIVNIFFIVLLIICTLIYIFAFQIVELSTNVRLSNSVSTLTPADYIKFTELLRILIISPIILCISSIFSSLLQVRKYFWTTTLAPLFYNFGIIASALYIRYYGGEIDILAYGVVIGSILHFLVQVPAIFKAGIEYSPVIDIKDKYVHRAIKNTLPRMLSLASDYIGNIFQVLVALNLPTGSLTAFKLAISIRDLPSSMFGISIAQAYFPKMTEHGAKGEILELQKIFSKAIRHILFWTIPVTVLIIVLRTPIVQLIYGVLSKNVDFRGTNLIAYALLFLSAGVIFYSVLAVVNRAFFALNDSVTPSVISVISIFIELTLTYTLVNLFSNFDDSLSLNPIFVMSNLDNYFINGNSSAAVGGIALASSLAIFINLAMLIRSLKKKGINFFFEPKLIFNKTISGFIALVIGLIAFRLPFADAFGLFNTEKVYGVILTTLNISFITLLTYYICEKLFKDEDVSLFENAVTKIGSYIIKLKNLFVKNKIIGVGTGS